MAVEWDHGRKSIDGKVVFSVQHNSVLHLVSFPQAVKEEQIRDLVQERKLRVVTPDEWVDFLADQRLEKADCDIALMFTGQWDDSEARFPATMVYRTHTREMEMVSNWLRVYWEPGYAFLFAEESPEHHRVRRIIDSSEWAR